MIWVGYDAKVNKITSNGKPYSFNNGAFSWVVTCLLLWIFAFPYYLAKRSKALRERAQTPPAPAPAAANSTEDELRRLKDLLAQGLITQDDFDAKKKQLLGL